jgi:hypothetical protein
MISLALSLDAGLLWYLQPVAKGNLELEAEVGIERGSFTAPNLTHSVSSPNIP